MSFKKKSLAKLAKLRSKSSHNIPDDLDNDETQSSLLSLQNKQKRMSLHSSAHLDIPLSKANAASTPNLGVHPIQPILHHFGSRSLARNHSLKYLKSSLHGSNDPLSFDHNFEKLEKTVSDGSRLRRRLLRKKIGGSIDSNEYPSTSSSDSKELNTPRRVKSLRLAPILRLENENGVQVQNALSPTEEVTSPISIPGTPKTSRVPNAYAASRSPSISPTSTHSLNPNPYESSSGFPHSQSNSPDEDDSDNNSEELPTRFFTPPLNGAIDIEQELRMSRRVSISKSRSMNSIPSSQGSGTTGQPPTTRDARGRSFLMGSMGPTSLLGAIELEKCFPDRTIRIFVGTWNMNGNSPPRHLAEFLLPQNLDYVPDILVVGTQEGFPDRHEWEVRLQDTLGPTHVLFHSYSLGTLHQAIFLRRDLIWYCSVPETESINTRPGSQFKTKGAIATGFLLFGTSFLFVNSHLTAHEENIKDRIKDLKRINAMLSLSKTLPLRAARHKDISDKFDCVFWCGDLNFRIEQNRDYVIREVQDGMSVLEFDQLNYLRKEGLVFKGYKECSISFQPTFKYDVGTDTFDTSHKQRTPSYTDRILFKHGQATHLKSLYYDSVQGVLTSDHKPVWGMWEAQIRPGRDSIALAGGLFNREVYLDGLKRRAEALQPVLSGKSSSHMCSLQ